MQRETQKDRIILCRYDPTEPGDYRVEVRWAGVLVPGSPFPVKIVDTQDELLMLTQVTIIKYFICAFVTSAFINLCIKINDIVVIFLIYNNTAEKAFTNIHIYS